MIREWNRFLAPNDFKMRLGQESIPIEMRWGPDWGVFSLCWGSGAESEAKPPLSTNYI